MGFLAPSALFFGLLAIPLLALYLLRVRGRERRVSSTFLWRHVVHDIEANTLWQRLRPSLLLLLQLLALAALVLALAGTYFLRASGIDGDLILVLDASASMQASDVVPSRFGQAQQEALRLIDQLPQSNLATVIRMGDVPEVLVAQSQDKGRVRRAIEEARPTAGGADLDSALSLAASVVRGERRAQVVVLSDGSVSTLQSLGPLPFDLQYEPVGASHGNLAIAAFSIRTTERGTEGLARVANYGPDTRAVSLHLFAGGSLYDVRELEVVPGADRTVSWSSLPEVTVLEARLVPGDAFALDDRAWAAGGPGNEARVLLVSAGNRFLEKALSLQPGLQVSNALPGEFSSEHDFDLWVFRRFSATGFTQGRGVNIGPASGQRPVGVRDGCTRSGDSAQRRRYPPLRGPVQHTCPRGGTAKSPSGGAAPP